MSSIHEGLISKYQFIISGILTTVFGIDELCSKTQVVCLWLHHGRSETQESVQPLARHILQAWNARSKSTLSDSTSKGLIAVTFDQRNHGSRKIDERANRDWLADGTAVDNSVLLDHLPTYVCPGNSCTISDNIILGVSLGGHSAWQCIFYEKRFRAAVIVIGCPDYIRLMSHRAERSGLTSWYGSTSPGADFLGSNDFPSSLIDIVHKRDPVGNFLGANCQRGTLQEQEGKEMREILKNSLAGKKILVLSGAADNIVPYSCARPFLDFLKREIANDEHLIKSNTYLEDILFPGTGHTMSERMKEKAVKFIIDTMSTDCISQPLHNSGEL